MKQSIFALVLFALASAGAASHAREACRKSAIAAARLAAPQYKHFFDLAQTEETPDIVSYEVTLADVIPDPNVTTTVEITLLKTTCALIANPVQK